MVLSDPDGVEAEPLGVGDLVECCGVERRRWQRPGGRVGEVVGEAEAHGRSSHGVAPRKAIEETGWPNEPAGGPARVHCTAWRRSVQERRAVRDRTALAAPGRSVAIQRDADTVAAAPNGAAATVSGTGGCAL